MQSQRFWKHWKITEDPFCAEEARDDPVLRRLIAKNATHPDFDKIFGQTDRVSSAVVFGEKGSGKTAVRLAMESRLDEYNFERGEGRVWMVRYDDLNPVLDRFSASVKRGGMSDGEVLEKLCLDDHQDAVLSLVMTRLVDEVLGGDDQVIAKGVKGMSKSERVSLGVLGMLYDHPRRGSVETRWEDLRRKLGVGWMPGYVMAKWGGLLLVLVGLGIYMAGRFGELTGGQGVAMWALLAIGGLLLGYWAKRWVGLWGMSRKVAKELRVMDRDATFLRGAMGRMPKGELEAMGLPGLGHRDSRYLLTETLLGLLDRFGYGGVMVLVDRIDEPAMVSGDAQKMKSIVWPLFDNKFLQQDGVGLKLLLPIELGHLLRREGADFYQRARLDKQHLIEQFTWSGAMLYDLCSQRLEACAAPGEDVIGLGDLFEEDVAKQDVIDALDQMQQPRDAFKFLYQVVNEHCSTVPQDQPAWRIPRLTLHQVRKLQSKRLHELQRGVTPA